MNLKWSVGSVPPRENVQFTNWPSSVKGPSEALACWLNNKEDGSSTVNDAVVVFHVNVSQSDAASKLPVASVGCRASTYEPSCVVA